MDFKKKTKDFGISVLAILITISFIYLVPAGLTILGNPFSSTDYNVSQNGYFAHLNLTNISPYRDGLSGYGIVSYWNFDLEDSAEDLSQNRLNGTYEGGLIPDNDSFIGKAITFDRTSKYVDVTDQINDIEGLNFGTATAWFKIHPSEGEANQRILTMANSGNTNELFQFGLGNVGSAYPDESAWFTLRSNSVNVIQMYAREANSSLYADGEWHHFAVRVGGFYAGKSNAIFIDGVEKAISYNGIGDNTTIAFSNLGSPNNARIGARFYNGVEAFSNFTIDELMIFNESLSNAQIIAIYQNQSERFKPIGQIEFYNVNISDPNGVTTLNITVDDYQNFQGTNISLQINDGDFTNLSSDGSLRDVNVDFGTEAVNFTFKFHSDSQRFYTPALLGNLQLTTWNSSVTSSCESFTGDSLIFQCADLCYFNEERNITGNVTFSDDLGDGSITFNTTWYFTNPNSYVFFEPCTYYWEDNSGFN